MGFPLRHRDFDPRLELDFLDIRSEVDVVFGEAEYVGEALNLHILLVDDVYALVLVVLHAV